MKNTFPQGAEQQYATPQIEVIEVETSQNILGGSTPPATGTARRRLVSSKTHIN